MITDPEAFRIIIEEQRRDYDYLLHIYDRMRATEGVLLTATFGILAYLYYGAPLGVKKGILERLFIPTEDYGKVIYVIAAGFFAYGLLKLMFTVFGDNPWETIYEAPKTNYKSDPIETLRYVKKRHDKCLGRNAETYEKRRLHLKFLFYCILISATVLIVIKTLN